MFTIGQAVKWNGLNCSVIIATPDKGGNIVLAYTYMGATSYFVVMEVVVEARPLSFTIETTFRRPLTGETYVTKFGSGAYTLFGFGEYTLVKSTGSETNAVAVITNLKLVEA